MGKKKSDIVGDMMRGTQIVKTLSDALRDMGGSDQDLLKILDPQSPYPVLIGELLMEKVAKPAGRRETPANSLVVSMVPGGWKVMQDVPPSQFEVKDLEFFNFLSPGQLFVSGEQGMELAAECGADLGLADARFVLDHCAELPKEAEELAILFPGTVVVDHEEQTRVPYLAFREDKWDVGFYWICGEGWGGYFRFARLKNH
jgi:hypothetical protein